jgi:hypothetical protein
MNDYPVAITFGCGEVPSISEILLIGNSFPDNESRRLFLSFHVSILEDINNNLHDPARYEFYRLLEEISDRIGIQYCKFLTAWTRKNYYDCIFCGVVLSPRTVYELTNNNLTIPVQTLIEKWKSEGQELQDKYPEYAQAMIIVSNFWQTANQLSSHDQTLAWLLNKLQDIVNQTSKEDWKSGKRNQYQSTTCHFCNRLFRFERKRGASEAPVHCDSDKCKKSYQCERKRKQRIGTQILGNTKPSWVSSGKRRICKGENEGGYCAELRVVNSDGFCKKCFSCDLNRL